MDCVVTTVFLDVTPEQLAHDSLSYPRLLLQGPRFDEKQDPAGRIAVRIDIAANEMNQIVAEHRAPEDICRSGWSVAEQTSDFQCCIEMLRTGSSVDQQCPVQVATASEFVPCK